MITKSGAEHWYQRGHLHRTNGPAIMNTNGGVFWYINGERIYFNEEYQLRAGLSDEELVMIILKYGNITCT